MEYLKTVNVTNTKNVLVQIPAYIVQAWNLRVGDTLEVCYDTNEEAVRITRAVNKDVQD